jgi:hypothetical protein
MRAEYLRLLCSFLIVIMTVSGFSSILAGSGEGNVILNQFTSGDSYTVTFPVGGGSDNKSSVKLPIDASVQEASMRLTAEASNGIYPFHVALDVGENGVTEWEFDEIGSGAMGFQRSFWNGVNNTPFNMAPTKNDLKYNLTMGFRIPAEVTIDSAKMNVWAEEQDYLDEVIELNLPGGGYAGPWDDVHDYDPDLVNFDNKLIDIFRTHSDVIGNGTDGDLVINWTTDGITWSDQFAELSKVPDGTWPWDNTRAHWWGMDMRPSMAIYDDGGGERLYIAWESNSTKVGPYPIPFPEDDDSRGITSGYDKDIVILSSSDGVTWSDNVNDFIEITNPWIEDGNTTNMTGYNTKNPIPQDWLAQLIVFDGKLWCAWVTNNTHSGPQEFGGSDIMITWSDDPQTHDGWNNTNRIFNVSGDDTWNGSDFNPKLVVFQNKLFIFWQTNDTTRGNGSDYDILYRYTSNGVTWSGIQQFSPRGMDDWTEEHLKGYDQGEFWDVTPNPVVFNNKLGIVWETENWHYTYNRTWNQPVDDQTDADLVVAWSNDGITWDLESGTNVFEITPPENDWGDHYPHLITFDPDKGGPQPERLYCTWNSNDKGVDIWDYDIMYSYSTDGETWVPQRFGSTHPDNGGGDFWAHLGWFKNWIYITYWSFDDKDGDKSGKYADGLDADVLVRRIIPSYLPATQVSIDVNNDGTKEYGPGDLDTTVKEIDIKSALAGAISSASTFHTDDFNNKYVDVTLNVSSPDVPCRIWVSDINITYSASGGKYYTDVADFSYALNEYIRVHSDEADSSGMLEIPIEISSKSAGKLTMSDINIEYNRKPTITVTSPGDTLAFAKESFTIAWVAADADDPDAAITLYYDSDNIPLGETEIDTSDDPLVVGVDNSFDWDTSGFAIGSEYYIKAVIDDGTDTVYSYSKAKVRVTKDNVPPTIAIVAPGTVNVETEYDFWVEWIDADEDSNAWVSIYYDTNKDPSDGNTLIVDGIRENDETDKYHWIIGDDVGVGTYFIYMEISDEENTTSAYSQAAVVVTPPSLKAPVDFKMVNNLDETGTELRTHDILPELSWSNNPLNPIPDETNMIEYRYIVNVGTSSSNQDDLVKNYVTRTPHIKLANNLSYGQTYWINVKVTDGRNHYSPTAQEKFSVENNPPGAPTISISPANPTTESTLEVIILNASVDPDGDFVTYRYQWIKNNVPAKEGEISVNPSETTKGDLWEVRVTPYDSVGGVDRTAGTAAVAKVAIGNAAPKPKIVSPLNNSEYEAGEAVKFQATGNDPDDDDPDSSLTFQWKSNLDGVLGSEATITKSDLRVAFHTITLTVSDGDTSITRTFRLEIKPATTTTDGKEGSEQEGSGTAMAIIALIVIVIIVVVILMLVMRRKGGGREEPMYPELDQQPVEEPTGPSAEEMYAADEGLPPPESPPEMPAGPGEGEALPPAEPTDAGEAAPPQLPEAGGEAPEEAPGETPEEAPSEAPAEAPADEVKE